MNDELGVAGCPCKERKLGNGRIARLRHSSFSIHHSPNTLTRSIISAWLSAGPTGSSA